MLEDEPAWPVFVDEVRRFLSPTARPAPSEHRLEELLSPRELEVLRLVGRGARQRRDRRRAEPQHAHGRAASAERLRQARLCRAGRPGLPPRPRALADDRLTATRWPPSPASARPPEFGCSAPMRAAGADSLTSSPVAATSGRLSANGGAAMEHRPCSIPIKAKHRAMWALGDYDRIATEVVGGLGAGLVEAAGVQPGERVLDVAAGSGNASLPAARAGARVVATDLTPELLEIGRQRSAAAGWTSTGRKPTPSTSAFADDGFDVTHVVRRRDVRAVPPAGRRRTGPGHPARRADRADQLDAGGIHRAAVRDHEAVRGRRRRPARHRGRSGATRRTCARCSATGSRSSVPSGACCAVDRFASAEEFRDFFASLLRADDRGVPQRRR